MDPDSGSDAGADQDQDGVNNGGEYIAGTDLSDNGDFPAIDSIVPLTKVAAMTIPMTIRCCRALKTLIQQLKNLWITLT